MRLVVCLSSSVGSCFAFVLVGVAVWVGRWLVCLIVMLLWVGWVYCLLTDFVPCGGLCFDMCLELSFAGLFALLWFCRLGVVCFGCY